MTDGAPTSRSVSVIGLGAMGSILARTLASRGCDVTVWNRSPERALPLADEGCGVAGSAQEAVLASPLTIVCILNDEAVSETLELDQPPSWLSGRVIANLSTSGLADAAAHGSAIRAAGGSYLAGGILSYPRMIGEADGVILYSGDKRTFEEHRDTLALLAGSQRYVGPGDSDCAAMFVACWAYYFGAVGGFFEAAAFAESAGIALAEFESLLPTMTSQLLGGLADSAQRIATSKFAGDQASVETHIDGLAKLANTMTGLGVRADILNAFVTYCRLAVDAGDGLNDISTLVKAIRTP